MVRGYELILALDLPTLDSVDLLFDQLDIQDYSEVVAVKVGFSLGLTYGLPAVVQRIKHHIEDCDISIIYDHQKAATDIPRMGQSFAKVCSDAGVDEVIFFPMAGPRTLEGFVRGAQDEGLISIVGIVMTHEAYVEAEGGYISDFAPFKIFEQALDLGVINFVLPATKPDVISNYSSLAVEKGYSSLNIMTPGVGTQGGTIEKVYSASNPHHAYAIVGSAIYKADNPKGVLEEYIRKMNNLTVVDIL